MQNIAHHSKLICYLERARINALETENIGYAKLLKMNTCFVINDIKLKFVSPAKLGDKLTIITTLTGAYSYSFKLNQIIIKSDDIKLPIDNFIGVPNTILCSSMRCCIVDVENTLPVNENNKIFDLLEIRNLKSSFKDVNFKHPFM
jgi:YbgC/YbaW family acyl-CoA thioester hydrolase